MITPITHQDASQISAIHSAAFSIDGLRGWDETECADMLKRPEYFGWLIKDSAFILLRNIDDSEIEIISLATHPSHRRKGLARTLIKQLITNSNASTIHLETRETNIAALALYHALGFTQTGIRPNYYKDGKGGRVNAVMMAYQND